MKVLIVSDTHGKDENLEAAVYKEAPFDLLIHCGDVEGREIFTEALVDPVHAVWCQETMTFSQICREKNRSNSAERGFW